MEWLAEHPGSTTPAMTQVATDTSIKVNTNDGIETKVRTYFSDIPVMIPIAECESRFRQFNGSGNPLDGGAGGMIGIYQINASVHDTYAKSLGMDISTVDGNLAYARKLYQEDGTDPWLDSFSCWNKQSQNQVAAGGSSTLTQNLVLGSISPEVKALQIILNNSGYVLTTDGPGSPGQETTKFGALTRVAVRKFQCEKMQICTGDEGTNGYGVVGASTREALLALSNKAPAPDPTIARSETDGQDAQIETLKKQIAELTAILNSMQKRS
jgi:hypothetical protein